MNVDDELSPEDLDAIEADGVPGDIRPSRPRMILEGDDEDFSSGIRISRDVHAVVVADSSIVTPGIDVRVERVKVS